MNHLQNLENELREIIKRNPRQKERIIERYHQCLGSIELGKVTEVEVELCREDVRNMVLTTNIDVCVN
jgi:hypothetical protein